MIKKIISFSPFLDTKYTFEKTDSETNVSQIEILKKNSILESIIFKRPLPDINKTLNKLIKGRKERKNLSPCVSEYSKYLSEETQLSISVDSAGDKGKGLFARKTFSIGEKIGDYFGLIRSKQDTVAEDLAVLMKALDSAFTNASRNVPGSNELLEVIQTHISSHSYTMDIDPDGIWLVDARASGNYTRFINDANTTETANVNLLMRKSFKNPKVPIATFVANREITPGEEIICNFGQEHLSLCKKKEIKKLLRNFITNTQINFNRSQNPDKKIEPFFIWLVITGVSKDVRVRDSQDKLKNISTPSKLLNIYSQIKDYSHQDAITLIKKELLPN
jgi:hypothetical protein